MIPPKTKLRGYAFEQKGYSCFYKGITLNKNGVEAWLSDSKACGKIKCGLKFLCKSCNTDSSDLKKTYFDKILAIFHIK